MLGYNMIFSSTKKNSCLRVSIITVSFNSASTIEETIRSVFSQSYKEIEYIIIDGGSGDQTLSIIDKYKDKISKVVSEKDDGIYDAMNKGIRLATGEIIGILNSDDIYADEKVIEKVVTQMEQSKADVCWGDLEYVKRDNLLKVTRKWQSSAYSPGIFQKGWQLPHPALFVRKSVYEKYGLYNTALIISADYEISLRLLEKNKVPSVYIPETLVKMREGGSSNWKNIFRVFEGNSEVRQAWKMNNLPMPFFTIWLKLFYKLKQTL